jgi:hypothetical protein
MKLHMLLGALALCAAFDAGAVDFIGIYDSALSGAQAYALTDPSRVPEPTTGLLLALVPGLLGVSMALRRPAVG